MTTTLPRDTQRAAVYAAEQLIARVLDRSTEHPIVEIAGSRLTLPPERRFGDLPAVQRYVDDVLALDWVRERWPRAAEPVTVRARRGSAAAHYERSRGVIAVPGSDLGGRWALRELVVLHEIAHHLAADPAEPGHGSGYVQRYVSLVEGVVGPEGALLLRVVFDQSGVLSGREPPSR